MENITNENLDTSPNIKVMIPSSVWKVVIDTTTQLFETKCVTEISVSEFLTNFKLKVQGLPFENKMLFGVISVECAHQIFEDLKARRDEKSEILCVSPSVFFLLLMGIVSYHKYLTLGFVNRDQAEVSYNAKCFLDNVLNNITKNNGEMFRSKDLFKQSIGLIQKAFDKDLVLFIDHICLVENSGIVEFRTDCNKTAYLATLFMIGVYSKRKHRTDPLLEEDTKTKEQKRRRSNTKLKIFWWKAKKFFKAMVQKGKRFF